MRKERILDVLFWLGFFTTLIFIFINSPLFFLGIILVLISLIVNFSSKNFLLRDIYVLGYFIGAMFSVAAIKDSNTTTILIGLFVMLFSILMHKYVTHKFEKKEKHKIEHIVHHREQKKENKIKKRPHLLSILWALLSIILLVLSVNEKNIYLLYVGLLSSVLAIIVNIVDIKQKPHSKIEKHNQPEINKKPINKDQRFSQMKHFIALKNSKYETDIDKLYKVVEKYKKIKLSEIKKLFNITNEKAEEWAKILEEHKLVELHYPAFGEPELKWKQ